MESVISKIVDLPAPKQRPARANRALIDELLAGFHHACDMHDVEVASRLVKMAESALVPAKESSSAFRRRLNGVVAAYERLWVIRRTYRKLVT